VASGGGDAEEARTRSFAAPAFAGCAFIAGVDLFVLGCCRRCSLSRGDQGGIDSVTGRYRSRQGDGLENKSQLLDRSTEPHRRVPFHGKSQLRGMGLGDVCCSERSIFSIGLWLFERSPGYDRLTYNRVRQVGNRLSPRALYGDWSQTVGNFGERHGELRNGPNGAAARARTPFPMEVFTDESKARRWLSEGRDEELAVR
jgi:hypothetical protein